MIKLKIAIVGNCQARPLASQITNLLECEINLLAIVHLLTPEDEADVETKLCECDIIISQLISDNYPVKFIATNYLRSKFGSKLICIPNLFYMGYTPDLRYFRIKGGGTLQGPLCDYHSGIIFNSWEKGLSASDALLEYTNKEVWSDKYSNTHNESLKQLKLKEKMTDIVMSDVIEDEKANKRLFFTFNHPSNYLLQKLIHRVLNLIKTIGISSKNIDDSTNKSNEPLGQFIVPVSDFVVDSLSLNHIEQQYQIYQGMKKDSVNNKFYKIEYTLEQLIEEFYSEYDNNRQIIESSLVR